MITEVSPARLYAGGLHAFIAGLPPGMRMEGHRHDQPTLVLVVRGAVRVVEDGEEFRDRSGTLCLCGSGLTRTVTSGKTGADCLVVTCEATHAVARHAIWKSVGA